MLSTSFRHYPVAIESHNTMEFPLVARRPLTTFFPPATRAAAFGGTTTESSTLPFNTKGQTLTEALDNWAAKSLEGKTAIDYVFPS